MVRCVKEYIIWYELTLHEHALLKYNSSVKAEESTHIKHCILKLFIKETGTEYTDLVRFTTVLKVLI